MSHVSQRLTEKHFPEPQQPQGTEARAFDFHYLKSEPISPIYIERDGGLPCGPGNLHFDLAGVQQVRPCNAGELEVELNLPIGSYGFELMRGNARIARGKGRSAPAFKKARLV